LIAENPATGHIVDTPEWWDNSLGTESVIVPGFAPITVTGTRIVPSGRVYDWLDGYFPASIVSKGGELARAMRLTATVHGTPVDFKPTQVTVTAHSETFAEIHATGEPIPHLRVEVDTRIEYDGVAMSTIRLIPTKPVDIDGLDFHVEVLDAHAMQVIGFKAGSIRPQKNRNDILQLPYTGEFINAIGLADGDRSFWWFADNAEGWIWNADTVTEVRRAGDVINLRQRLVGGKWRIEKPMTFKMNFLATPVKPLDPQWRGLRVMSGVATKDEARLGSHINPWWTSAFAYDTYPYLDLAPSAKQKIPLLTDQRAYPGLRANAALVQRDLERYGIHRLPYFSTHALSELDDNLLRFKSQWVVQPPRIYKDVVGPFKKVFEKPILTHRARSYSNYLLWQLNDVIGRLNIEGIYFDHGAPAMSCNPNNGGWQDSNGQWQPSLDILGLREYLKRLRVLFALHDKAGYIIIHNSNREVMPAYTFAYATLDGEQYRGGQVRDGDYLAAVSLDELRTRMSPDQYGIPVIWLPSAWTYHKGDKDWSGSPSQRMAYRRLMALALLHDTLDLPKGAHPSERRKLIAVLDDFGIAKAQFIGYWSEHNPIKVDNSSARVSTYIRENTHSYLAVVMNISNKPITARLVFDEQNTSVGGRIDVTTESGGEIRAEGGIPSFTLHIEPRDFQWVRIKRH